jgi:hypothetical protein
MHAGGLALAPYLLQSPNHRPLHPASLDEAGCRHPNIQSVPCCWIYGAQPAAGFGAIRADRSLESNQM